MAIKPLSSRDNPHVRRWSKLAQATHAGRQSESQTQAAQTNPVMLSAKLRSFMEGATAEIPPQLRLDLIDANGQKHGCDLTVQGEALEALLSRRMENGVRAFVSEMARLGTLWAGCVGAAWRRYCCRMWPMGNGTT